jgi:hypothetical protein
MASIKLNDTNDMIQQGIKIRETFKNVLPTFCMLQKDQLAINYTSNDFNAFVFNRKDILRFFKEDLKDKNGTSIPPAEHLIVIVGAQIADGKTDSNQSFKQGDLTVIAAGVNKITDNNYVCLNIDNPADEHTPRAIVSELNADNSGNNELRFNIRL